MLRNIGRFRDYVPYIGTEQDVIETVFSPHRELFRPLSRTPQPAEDRTGHFMEHAHGKDAVCNASGVYFGSGRGRAGRSAESLKLKLPGSGQCCPQLFHNRFSSWFPL